MRITGPVLSMILVAGCSAPAASAQASGPPSQGTASPTAAPSTRQAPPGTTLIRDGTLHSGVTYATAGFAKQFTFVVPADTPDRFWFASETSLQHVVQVGNPALEGEGVAFYLPTGGFDADGTPGPVPSDFVAWLTTNPHLTVVERTDITVGGLPAVALKLHPHPETITTDLGGCHASEKCIPVASTSPDAALRPLVVLPEGEPMIVVVNLGAGQMLISEDPGTAFAPSQALVASLHFVP